MNPGRYEGPEEEGLHEMVVDGQVQVIPKSRWQGWIVEAGMTAGGLGAARK